MPKPKLPPEAMQILQRLSRIADAHPVDTHIHATALRASISVIDGMKCSYGDSAELIATQLDDWTELHDIANAMLHAVGAARKPVELAAGGSRLRRATTLEIVAHTGMHPANAEAL